MAFLDPNTHRCPRCNGNLYIDSYIEMQSGNRVGTITCLACGRELDIGSFTDLTPNEEVEVLLAMSSSTSSASGRNAAPTEGRHSKRYTIADADSGWKA